MPVLIRARHRVRTASAIGALALVLAGTGTAHAATRAAHAKTTGAKPSANASSKKAPAAGLSHAQAEQQAQAQAKKTGKSVTVAGTETATSVLSANPDGTFALATAAQPVRALVGGTWQNLDATLKKNPGGTFSPTLSSEPLIISGGGTGPLATMRDGFDSLALTLPVALPAPAVSGATATYHDVVPGIDLIVTVTDQGSFSDVYRIDTPAAAANPKLAALLTATTTTRGVTVTTDAAGDIAAVDSRGRDIFTASAPDWWDSATTTKTSGTSATPSSNSSKTTAVQPDTTGRSATRSSAAAPGAGAHVGRLKAHVSGKTLSLTPDQAIAAVPAADFPVYADPSWEGAGGALTNKGWSTVSENYPTDRHYDSSPEQVGAGLMQVGQSSAGFWADTLINFGLPLGLLGPEGTSVKITGADFTITAVGADACTPQTDYLYAPSQTLVGGSNTNATWNDWFTSSRNLGPAISSATFDHRAGDTSCNSGGVGFQMSGSQLSWITKDVAASKSVQTLALAGASYSAEEFTGDGPGQNDYAVFDQNTPVLTIYFEHAPAVPDHLSTSPDQSVIGKGSVNLNAHVYDPDGGTLKATFSAWLDGHTDDVIGSGTLSVGSGDFTSLYIPEATLNTAVVNTSWGQSATSTSMLVDWQVTVADTGTMSAQSAQQQFTYSTAVPGAPQIWDDAGHTQACGGGNYTVGVPVTLYVTWPTDNGAAAPTSYTYQLNATAGQSVAASASQFTVVPTANTDVITIEGIAASTNVGQAASCTINATSPANAAPGDMTGNGNVSLLLPGNGSAALPAGLWLAAGQSDGTLSHDAINIGQNGTGFTKATTSPSTYTGTQVISGLFEGSGYNDVLVYQPGTSACPADIINDDGQTTPLNPNWANTVTNGTSATDQSNNNSLTCAASIANGGNLYYAEGDGGNVPLTAPVTSYAPASQPDLLTVWGNSLYLVQAGGGDGYYMPYGSGGTFDLADTNPYCAANPTASTCTAANGSTWAGWQLTSVNTPSDIPALFAYSTSLNVVYYYSPATLAALVYDYAEGGSAPATPVQLTGPKPADYLNLQATLVDGTPGLYATDISSGMSPRLSGIGYGTPSEPFVDTFTISGTTLTSVGTTSLRTSSHDWPLNDEPDKANFTTAADDASGNLPLTAHGAVTGSTEDAVFSQDAAFDGTTGYLASTAAAGAINPDDDFTISAWVKPTALGGTVAAQGGADDPVVELAATTQGTWALSLNTTATGTAATYTTVSGGHVDLGMWTELTATYNQATGVATLYADGNEIAVGTDTTPPTATAYPFTLGTAQTSTGTTSYFAGYMADVETYDAVAAPVLTGTGASEYVPLTPTRIIDTRSSSKIGPITGPVAANATTVIQIAGNTTGGIDIPTAGVTAVAISVTETEATSNGLLTVFPDQTPLPFTSLLNYGSADMAVTNNAIVPVGTDGKIDINNNSTGTIQLIVDITGFYTTDTSLTNASTYMPLTTPTRILDTRSTSKVGNVTGPVASDSTTTIQIAGNTTNGADIPTTGVTAIALNLTVTNATGGGLLIAYPDGTTRPFTTSLTYTTTSTTAATVIVPVGSDGKIDIYNSSTTAIQIIADVSGYYTTAITGQYYFPTGSDRILDTRVYNPSTAKAGPLTSEETFTLPVPTSALAANPTLVLNLTVVNETSYGDLDIYPASQTTAPSASAIDWAAGQTMANLNIAASFAGDGIDIVNQSPGTTQLVIDTDGYFAYATPEGRHDTLTHEWPLTDGSGSAANDTVGANPLAFNDETWATSTVGAQTSPSNVIDLDGASQFGQTILQAVDTSESYTVSAWADLDTVPTANATVVAQSGTTAAAFYLQYNATAKSWCVNYMTSDDQNTIGYTSIPCATIAPTAGTWYHLIATYNATTSTATLYVNGTAVGTATGIDDWSSSNGLTVGAAQLNGTTTDYFPGKISNVETYNYALSPAQAAQLYQQQN